MRRGDPEDGLNIGEEASASREPSKPRAAAERFPPRQIRFWRREFWWIETRATEGSGRLVGETGREEGEVG